MLLSYQRAFVFIHIEKAAGSSIQNALRPFAPPKTKNHFRRRLTALGSLNRLGGLYRAVEFPEHVTANEVKRCLPEPLYDSLFKFAFVRNPWDRLVSRYAHLLRSKDRRRHGQISRMEKFEDFLEWELQRDSAFQYAYVTGGDGKLIVNFIGYYERLAEDFAKVCARLKVQAELPRTNVSEHRDYRSYYTPKTRELVAKKFQRDIEMFGYNFDGFAGAPSTRSA
ncbi:MAG: hypothetical protein QOD03_218 [Verrucomicrobiota bacterium]|jgi:hypothetical protein